MEYFQLSLIAALTCLTAGRAELWHPFSVLITECDFIAQYQELVRDGKVIGVEFSPD